MNRKHANQQQSTGLLSLPERSSSINKQLLAKSDSMQRNGVKKPNSHRNSIALSVDCRPLTPKERQDHPRYSLNKRTDNDYEKEEKKDMKPTGTNLSGTSSTSSIKAPNKAPSPNKKVESSTNNLGALLRRIVTIIISLWPAKKCPHDFGSKQSNKKTRLGIELSRLGGETLNLQKELKNANYKPDAAQWAIEQLNKAITYIMKQKKVDLWQALAILEKNKDRIIEKEKTKQLKAIARSDEAKARSDEAKAKAVSDKKKLYLKLIANDNTHNQAMKKINELFK